MADKPLTLRTASLTSAAVTTGTLAGSTTTALLGSAGLSVPGAAQLAATLVALWTLATLNALVGHDRDRSGPQR